MSSLFVWIQFSKKIKTDIGVIIFIVILQYINKIRVQRKQIFSQAQELKNAGGIKGSLRIQNHFSGLSTPIENKTNKCC